MISRVGILTGEDSWDHEWTAMYEDSFEDREYGKTEEEAVQKLISRHPREYGTEYYIVPRVGR